MTPEEWERCRDPGLMLGFLRGKGHEPKLLGFVAACLRRHPRLLGFRPPRVLEVVERCAEGGQVSPTEWAEACTLLASAPLLGYWRQVTEEWAEGGAHDVDVAAMIGEEAAMAASDAAQAAGNHAGRAGADEQQRQADLLRCIFGSPFRPPTPPAPAVLAYNGGVARSLAESIYTARRFEDLPVLADLLEEAGCTDAALLGHLRGPGPHCPGCFALDAGLGRS